MADDVPTTHANIATALLTVDELMIEPGSFT